LTRNKIYFASDFHLGSPNIKDSLKREKLIIKWLDEIKEDSKAIYLIGDIFDFWFEYKKVIPKGFVRFLGKVAELTDSGIAIHFLVGNHDLWMQDYLEKEVGIKVHHENIKIIEEKKEILIGHGDGLGEGDYLYKFLRKIFTSKICQWTFARMHPNFALTLAHAWSKHSRKDNSPKFLSDKQEILFGYCQKKQTINPIDYYIFGHRHLPLELKLDEKATYINTGDWLKHYSYAILDNGKVELRTYPK
jgi:UDP-2,3-diacylglucosamine hydrolase